MHKVLHFKDIHHQEDSMTDPGKRNMDSALQMKPLGLSGTLILFIIPVAILYWAHYFLIPGLITKTGFPYLAGYLIVWPITMALFLIAALWATSSRVTQTSGVSSPRASGWDE